MLQTESNFIWYMPARKHLNEIIKKTKTNEPLIFSASANFMYQLPIFSTFIAKWFLDNPMHNIQYFTATFNFFLIGPYPIQLTKVLYPDNYLYKRHNNKKVLKFPVGSNVVIC